MHSNDTVWSHNQTYACHRWRATPRFLEGVVPLVGTGYLSHMAWVTSVFHIRCWYCDVWTKVWPLQKLWTSQVFPFRILILEKRLGVAIRNGSIKNFEIKFFGSIKKNISLKFLSFGYFLCQKDCTWTQINILFGIGWSWVAESTWLNVTATNNDTLKLRFFIRSPKIITSGSVISPRSRDSISKCHTRSAR